MPRTYHSSPPAGSRIFEDRFDRSELGGAWRPTGPGAVIRDGALHVAGLKNHPVWLTTPLPDDVRIQFDAWANSDQGDIKVELAGDGKSHATSPTYIGTGYVLVFGGWNNRLNVIARQNEHGRDRVVAHEPLVEPDRRYHMTIERQDGELRWEIDGREVARFDDSAPLRGPEHRHFAFGGWEAEVSFDNLVIEAL